MNLSFHLQEASLLCYVYPSDSNPDFVVVKYGSAAHGIHTSARCNEHAPSPDRQISTFVLAVTAGYLCFSCGSYPHLSLFA